MEGMIGVGAKQQSTCDVGVSEIEEGGGGWGWGLGGD